jgi:hypothetical protein
MPGREARKRHKQHLQEAATMAGDNIGINNQASSSDMERTSATVGSAKRQA